jgi:hypothetical protein
MSALEEGLGWKKRAEYLGGTGESGWRVEPISSGPRVRSKAAGVHVNGSQCLRLLVVAAPNDRLARLGEPIDFATDEIHAITRVVSREFGYRAVVAWVEDSTGRSTGYRLTMTLRGQLQLSCPIYLVSTKPTPSARAYALQCGATRLLADDEDLLDDLSYLLKAGRGEGATKARKSLAGVSESCCSEEPVGAVVRRPSKR